MPEKASNIYSKLTVARKRMAESPLKKTGYNGFSKYNYFQLDDFMPTATKVFADLWITPVFNTDYHDYGNGIIPEATLTIINDEAPGETIVFRVPWTSANQSNNPIQNLGSTITYLRRYLMMVALDLTETDVVEATSGGPEDHSKENKAAAPKQKYEEPKITQQQVEKILGLYDPQTIETLSKKKGHANLGEWTAAEAMQAIRFKEAK